ncbi:MAG: hypothetical protein GPJ54_12230 [Candidatus Heimdallarchaeota archaeon]|nr:hypothetical protein [Candidatus Heimdallarchaeota archaeon]
MATGQISVRLNDEMKNLMDEIQEENLLDDTSSTVRYLIRFYAKFRNIPRDILEQLYETHKPFDR